MAHQDIRRFICRRCRFEWACEGAGTWCCPSCGVYEGNQDLEMEEYDDSDLIEREVLIRSLIAYERVANDGWDWRKKMNDDRPIERAEAP
jgi:hypothetical protein